MSQTKQLEQWSNEFGVAYTERNAIDWKLRKPAFEQMIAGLPIASVLEVGCNRGHNLVALKNILPDATIMGIDPNRHALQRIPEWQSPVDAIQGNVFDLPFKSECYDLTFTAGVLIHVALSDLPAALDEIHRVSKKHILAIEYFAEEETTIPYRDHQDLLWKRNFKAHYEQRFPNLKLIRSGYWDAEHGFDRSHWWMFEKC